MASSGHSKCIPDLVRPVTTSTPTRIFWTDRLRCFLMYYSIPRRTMNEIDLKDLLKKENHDRKIKVNQRTQYFFFLQFIKKIAAFIELEVSLLVITGTPSILCISPCWLAVHRVLVEQHMVHCGHFFFLTREP